MFAGLLWSLFGGAITWLVGSAVVLIVIYIILRVGFSAITQRE